jgi:hypothetical protein
MALDMVATSFVAGCLQPETWQWSASYISGGATDGDGPIPAMLVNLELPSCANPLKSPLVLLQLVMFTAQLLIYAPF